MPNLFQVEPPMNPSPSTDNVIANTELFKETVGWTCKNEFNPTNIKSGYAIFGDSQGAYINTSTNGLTYVAQIKTDTDYTISRKNGIGNEFVIALFTTQPTIPNTTPETNSEVIIDDATYDTYTFNSDDYQWVAFTVNDTTGDPSTLVTTVEAMLCKAEILDGSYEAHHDSVDAVKQNKQLSSAITVNGTSYSQVESALGGLASAVSKSVLLDLFYPVGTIYESANSSFNPNTAWGGSWSKIEGKFLLGSSTSYTIGSTGGEATHTLTESEMPRHRHTYSDLLEPLGELGTYIVGAGNEQVLKAGEYTTYAGGDGAHNNMPPYQVVNIWKRTA